MTGLTFVVPGKPAPQGSKSRGKNSAMFESSAATLKPWREAVTWTAINAIRNSGDPEAFPILGPVWLTLTFKFPRPNTHYGTGRNAGILKPNAPRYVATKPDWDKTSRAISDALTVAGVYRDDAQVALGVVEKLYAETPCVEIQVRTLAGPE